MMSHPRSSLARVLLVMLLATLTIPNHVNASDHPDLAYQGEFYGSVSLGSDDEPQKLGVQVVGLDDGEFRVLLHHGGLPGMGWDAGDDRVQLSAERDDDRVRVETYEGITFTHENPGLIARDDAGNVRGMLHRVERTSPTMGKLPLEDAIILFDGSNVDHFQDGARMVDGLLAQGARTADDYGDIYLHLEFKTHFMPRARGTQRANSGVYIQNRYEVQILDSFAEPPTVQGNGSLYNEHAPLLNMSYPPMQWQTYDIYFRAPRFDDQGDKTENARITVYHNGVLVQDDVELEQGTGVGGRHQEVSEAELYLQSHTGQVRFRNVWLVEDATPEPRSW